MTMKKGFDRDYLLELHTVADYSISDIIKGECSKRVPIIVQNTVIQNEHGLGEQQHSLWPNVHFIHLAI